MKTKSKHMQKQTKQTSRSRQTRRVNSKATSTKSATSRRRTLDGSIQSWISSKKTRPKTVFLTLQRTQDGYTVGEATIMNRTNQYGVRPVTVDVRAIVSDINKKGLTA